MVMAAGAAQVVSTCPMQLLQSYFTTAKKKEPLKLEDQT